MSSPIFSPNFMGQTPRNSGDVFTGEWQTVRGGGRAATFASGAVTPDVTNAPGAVAPALAGHVLLFSGGGRLNSINTIITGNLANSGVSVTFYDAASPVSGANVSGQRILSIYNPVQPLAVSGVTATISAGSINLDMPFMSGLCMQYLSGSPALAISFTPETGYPWPKG